jgi:hypothetical protein
MYDSFLYLVLYRIIMEGQFWRMLTLYNLGCILCWLIFFRNNKFIFDFVATLSLFIFIGYAIAIGVYGYQDALLPMYRAVYRRIGIQPPLWLIVIVDVCIHVGPVVYFGIPRDYRAIFAGYILIAVWYTVVRTYVHELYVLPSAKGTCVRDTLVYFAAPLLSIALMLGAGTAKPTLVP